MSITTKEGILKVLMAYNPWWKTGIVNPKMSKTYKRFAFYEEAKKVYAVIATGESALYANIMLQKGVVVDE